MCSTAHRETDLGRQLRHGQLGQERRRRRAGDRRESGRAHRPDRQALPRPAGPRWRPQLAADRRTTRRLGSSISRRWRPGFPFVPDAHWKPAVTGFNTGMDFGAAAMPADPKVRAGAMAAIKGMLIAWDPVAQKERWRVALQGPWNGGVLATAGGLVFQGSTAKEFAAYDAASGAQALVRAGCRPASSRPPSPTPSTASSTLRCWPAGAVSGRWRRASSLRSVVPSATCPDSSSSGWAPPHNCRPSQRSRRVRSTHPPRPARRAQVAEGAQHYGRFCGVCHGDAAYAGTLSPTCVAARCSTAARRGRAWCMTEPFGIRAWSASRTC